MDMNGVDQSLGDMAFVRVFHFILLCEYVASSGTFHYPYLYSKCSKGMHRVVSTNHLLGEYEAGIARERFIRRIIFGIRSSPIYTVSHMKDECVQCGRCWFCISGHSHFTSPLGLSFSI